MAGIKVLLCAYMITARSNTVFLLHANDRSNNFTTASFPFG